MDAKRIGPLWTDYHGDLPEPELTCVGCAFLRMHDYHYPYCSAQVVPNQTYPWRGAGVYLYVEKPNAQCPYPAPEKPAAIAA